MDCTVVVFVVSLLKYKCFGPCSYIDLKNLPHFINCNCIMNIFRYRNK